MVLVFMQKFLLELKTLAQGFGWLPSLILMNTKTVFIRLASLTLLVAWGQRRALAVVMPPDLLCGPRAKAGDCPCPIPEYKASAALHLPQCSGLREGGDRCRGHRMLPFKSKNSFSRKHHSQAMSHSGQFLEFLYS